jgi:hypothetical protein
MPTLDGERVTGQSMPTVDGNPVKPSTIGKVCDSADSSGQPPVTSNPYAMDIPIRILPVGEVLQRSAMDLLQYYNHVVAGIMPWIDGPENMWRTAIIPLALESSTLLYALLALAEEHRVSASKQGPSGGQHDTVLVSRYRDLSLQHLALGLQEMTGGQPSSSKEATLAATLVLCQLEMVRSDASLWKLHWNAMKTIAQAWTTDENGTKALGSTACFLLKEVFVYDAFASTTMFDCEDVIWCPPPADSDDELFVEHLTLVQQVTIAERCHYGAQRQQVATTVWEDAESIRSSFAHARLKNLRAIDTTLRWSVQQRQDLVSLIELYHHTAILYALQALLSPMETIADRANELQHAVIYAEGLQYVQELRHDLVWPLFVMGTEARGAPELQTFVEHNLFRAMNLTAFGNCHAALNFLRGFWVSAGACNWISHARDAKDSGTSFVVI